MSITNLIELKIEKPFEGNLKRFFVYFINKIYQSLRFNCLQVKATTDKLTQSGEKWNFVENSAKFF